MRRLLTHENADTQFGRDAFETFRIPAVKNSKQHSENGFIMSSTHWALVGGAVACLKLLALASPLTLLTTQAQAGQSQRDLAFPGYSGFLNVPSSTVLNHGQASLQWSDQAFLSGRAGFGAGRYAHLNNVSGNFGIFPNVELGGRVTWDKTNTNCFQVGCTIRDLSANVKVQAPFIPEEWFTMAAGVQDLGGETGDFNAYYLVAGKQIGPVELTAGFGKPDISDRYLDGAFGAVSYRPVPWLNIIAEHDSRDARLGLGATTPQGWLPFGLQVKAKVLAWDNSDAEDTRNFTSVGLSMPFGNRESKRRSGTFSAEPSPASTRPQTSTSTSAPATRQRSEAAEPAEALQTNEASTADNSEATAQQRRSVAVRLGEKLVAAGYDNVRVASDDHTLHIWWENNLYNRDERVSIREVAQMTRQAAGSSHQRARLTLLNQGLPVLTQTLALADQALADTTQLSNYRMPGKDQPDWDFEGSYGPSWKPRLKLSPAISSGVATEFGVWDASVALQAELSVNPWPGAIAAAQYNTEVYQSDDFEKGGAFFNNRLTSTIVEAEVQQTLKLHPQFYTSFHAGRYAINYSGFMTESLLLSPNARHTVGFLGGSFQGREDETDELSQSLASYSYYNPSLDTQVQVHAGQFLDEDTGFRVDSRFWFGDYAITLQYKNTDAEFISLGWVIPLSPTKDRQWRYLQVKGDADWNYSVQTRINQDTNDLSFGGARMIKSANPLQETYLNRGRIGQGPP